MKGARHTPLLQKPPIVTPGALRIPLGRVAPRRQTSDSANVPKPRYARLSRETGVIWTDDRSRIGDQVLSRRRRRRLLTNEFGHELDGRGAQFSPRARPVAERHVCSAARREFVRRFRPLLIDFAAPNTTCRGWIVIAHDSSL